jgi:long-subunit fatty acid transport protein
VKPTPLAVAGLRLGLSVAAASVCLLPGEAGAAGFDTPILYSARHQAMGGTAIGSVNDPSAAFHNPAGLQGVRGLALLGDFSLIVGKVRSTPDAAPSAQSLESNAVVAPFFLLGAGYRVHEWVSVGLAGFPVASGGAEYEYTLGPFDVLDSTEIVFFEATPLVSLNVPKDRWLPGKLSLGAGYRVSLVTLDRRKGAPEDPQLLNLSLSGMDFTGVRLGVQYQPIELLKLGLVFRNRVKVNTTAEEATVAGSVARDGELEFTLPAKLGFGARVDFDRVGLGVDVEWALQSQNERQVLRGTPEGASEPTTATNVYDWQNGVTGRFGAEYRVGARQSLPLRVGYIIDSTVSNPAYPSAFGTPPAPTHTFTAGLGYVQEQWQVNLAASRRFGSTSIDASELGAGCDFCGRAGDYSLTMTGLYVDVSVDLPL